MNLQDAASLAWSLMEEHGVKGWNLKFDNAKMRLGQTRFSTLTISLSKTLTALNPEEQVRNTILHEIAHVLVGAGNGHNHIWRNKALEIGCNGERVTNSLVKAKTNYTITCQNCGANWGCFRRPNLVGTFHRQCGRESINKLVIS